MSSVIPPPEKGNILIGDSDEKAQQKDEVLARLASFAVSRGKSPPVKKSRKYSSRFFFEVAPSGNTNIDIELIKKSHISKPLIPVNKEIEDRKKVYEQQLSPALNKNLQVVREFFLTELAPKTFATDGGLNQVLEIVGEVVGEIDPTALKQFERMAHQAVSLRLCRFAAKYFGLSKADTERLIDLTVNQYRTSYPNTTVVPIPVPQQQDNKKK